MKQSHTFPHHRRPGFRLRVIADGGTSAWLLRLDDDGSDPLGRRFTFRGASWEIRRFRDTAHAFVAEPVRH